MKLSRRLIPAFAMLLVSAVLMSTASYAWFAMNTTVSATGMTVSATASEDIFLEIKAVGETEGTYSTSATGNLNTALLPAAHEPFSGVNDIATAGNWFYKFSNVAGSDQSDAVISQAQTLESLDGYVATAQFKVRLNPNLNTTGYDLYVSEVAVTANTGITVIIAGANGYVEYDATQTDIDFNAGKILSNSVTSTEQIITVYIYIDGEDANVYTDNKAALTGTVSFELKAFVDDQNPES